MERGIYVYCLAGNAPARVEKFYDIRHTGDAVKCLSFSALDTRGKHAACILHDSIIFMQMSGGLVSYSVD